MIPRRNYVIDYQRANPNATLEYFMERTGIDVSKSTWYAAKKHLSSERRLCANGCSAPVCPPSKVICRACLDKNTAMLEKKVMLEADMEANSEPYACDMCDRYEKNLTELTANRNAWRDALLKLMKLRQCDLSQWHLPAHKLDWESEDANP